MILAPAMLIIAMNSKKISNARSAKDVFMAYKDGSAVVFDPNQVIDMLNSIIDDIFVLENSQQHDIVPILNENGSTGGTFKVENKIVSTTGSTGFLSNFISRGANTKRVSQNPLLVDEARRDIQKKLDVINDLQKIQNKIVSDFLFNEFTGKKVAQKKEDEESSDDIEFERKP